MGSVQRAAWEHTELPEHASELADRVAFAWRAMEAFYEEDERIVGHGRCLSPYRHRQTSRRLNVRSGDQVVATRPWPCRVGLRSTLPFQRGV